MWFSLSWYIFRWRLFTVPIQKYYFLWMKNNAVYTQREEVVIAHRWSIIAIIHLTIAWNVQFISQKGGIASLME